jgi:regulatory protein
VKQPPEAAMRIALRALGRRDHSRKGLLELLEKRDVPPDDAEAVVATLLAQGFLNEERGAAYVVDEARRRGYGKLQVVVLLTDRGYEAEVVEAALRDWTSEAEADAAAEALRHSFPARDPKERRRALALLARRGFEEETAQDAVARHFGGVGRSD